ncbi:integrin alpha-7 isoform X1 [Pangasianodon hypophthalmus]|uniref:integrin alpha-7 isoform X1 n=1 Tax=Pangasianodon hypophthalmus TaxID=310915 RepID=UPI0023080D21|nr:integrin alpha-7 isoform X1 [Pangasianodon hypophthalmus]
MALQLTLPVCVFMLLCSCVCGFNLETTDTLSKEGEHGSFFGFSLALHTQTTPHHQSWILVGAPRARGLGHLRHTHTGALYRCPITAEEFDCERVDIDGDVSLDRESKDNQWLGVTVKSQGIGGKVVTCAHLYELRQRVNQVSETRDPIGRCYVLSEDLSERDDLDGGEWKFCEGRPQGHEQFGFCQQGLAASFTPDNNYILFGAPGTYNWKGEMRVQLLNQTVLDLGYYDDGPYEVADEKQLNAALIPLPYHSYLGFSVDSAKGVMQHSELTFVAGAPRANHTGAVVLLKKDSTYRLVPEFILWGEELASSFGYSVSTTDLNQDGWTDIIVGAPNFFDRKAEIGGAVYVFLNPAGHWEEARPIRLNGTYDSMFGMTVSAAGDLDLDGYADFAVGAPFDGQGKVFIFRGSAEGIDTKPSQVLDGLNAGVSRFGYSISGGLDIDGNLYPDLAVGSLSDQVVLFRSRPVIHVNRDISVEPQHIDLTQHNCKGRDGVCVEVKACYSYRAQPESYSPYITLGVHFEADTERRKSGLQHRVQFLGRRSSEPEYIHSEELELRGQNQPACQTATFILQEGVRDKLRPVSLAITHTVKRTRHDGRGGDHTHQRLGRLTPALSLTPPNTLHSEVNFIREGCGDDNICQSNLKLNYRFGTRPSISDLFTALPIGEDGVPVFSLSDQRSVVLEVTVTNTPSEPAHPEEDGDDAHAAQLTLTLPHTLTYSGVRGQVVCEANQNGSQAECELGNPLKRDAVLTFYVILSTSGITVETTSLSVDLQVSTISEQLHLSPVTALARVVIELPLTVSGVARPHQLFFSGTVRGESAMETLEQTGSEVEFEFTVSNSGQSLQTLGSAFLNIMWPHELTNEKWLLYPTSLHSDRPHTHCTHRSALNTLGLKHTLHTHHTHTQQLQVRKTRSYPEDDGQEPVKNSIYDNTPAVAANERRKSLKLDCALGSARCVVFQCALQNFSGSAKFTIKARLWNSTFIEEFSAVSVLEVLVRANISVKSSIKHLVLRDAAAQVSVMVYPELSVLDQSWVPWWIILIAILAGVIVLAVIVCILWKFGFFRRSPYKDSVPQYHAVRIRQQERSHLHPDLQPEKLLKPEKPPTSHIKQWRTRWSDGTH